MFSLRRITLLMLFFIPLTTLFLLLMGIALTQAAILHQNIPQEEIAAINSISHNSPPLESVQQLSKLTNTPIMHSVNPSTYRIEKVLLFIGLAPWILIFGLNWIVLRKNYSSGVGEGSIGSSSPSSF